jgi:hypothetical protein
MSFFKGTSGKTKFYLPAYYTEGRKYIYDLIQGGTPNIPTQKVAGMTDAETRAQSLLSKYMNSSMPSGYSTALNELEKTVKGGYDPRTSEAYRGYREASKLEEEDAVNALGRQAQISGMAKSTPVLNNTGKTRRGYSADRLSYLGSLMNSERDRQLNATTALMEGADYASQLPLRQATAGMSLGALPRQLEQTEEDAIYNQIMQEIMFPYEVLGNYAQFLGGGGGGPISYYKEGGPSDLAAISNAASQIANIGFLGAPGLVGGYTGKDGQYQYTGFIG